MPAEPRTTRSKRWSTSRTHPNDAVSSIWPARPRTKGTNVSGCALTKAALDIAKNLAAATELFARAQFPAARGAVLKALRADARSVDAHLLMGAISAEQGRFEDAVRSFRRAAELAPRDYGAHANLARAEFAAGRAEEALAAIAGAIAIAPEVPELYLTHGNILLELGRLDDALVQYGKAVKLNPSFTDAHLNAAITLLRQKDYEAATAAFAEVLKLERHSGEAITGQFLARQQLCDWTDYETGRKEYFARIVTKGTSASFLAKLLSDDNDLLRRAAENAAMLLPTTVPSRRPTPQKSKRLRVAYVGADFRQHATENLAAAHFENHDRDRFEIYAISYGPNDGSAARERLVSAFEHFEDHRGRPAPLIAERMRELGITVAIDLMGHTRDAKLAIFRPRSAPIQVSFLGFPGTTAIPEMDYLIVDPFIASDGLRRTASEKLVILPDCYQPNDDKKPIADATPLRTDAGLPETGFVFCSFNQPLKVTPEMFAAWMRILRRTPASVLWLFAEGEAPRANLKANAVRHGVTAERLVFAGSLDRANHIARYRLADLVLDTFPYGAHTTASDALWAGCPILTYAGESFASRVCGSLLTTVGLPELVTSSLDAYELRAEQLAREPDELAALRRRLADNRATSALFDPQRFCRNFERALNEMVRLYRDGRAPTEIRVPSAHHES